MARRRRRARDDDFLEDDYNTIPNAGGGNMNAEGGYGFCADYAIDYPTNSRPKTDGRKTAYSNLSSYSKLSPISPLSSSLTHSPSLLLLDTKSFAAPALFKKGAGVKFSAFFSASSFTPTSAGRG
jgi:hypothetical protein